MEAPLLEVAGITKWYGKQQALADVSFNIRRGEILGLIGPNGSGKTTLFNVVSGLYAPDEGRVFLEDREITGARPAEVLARVAERPPGRTTSSHKRPWCTGTCAR